MVQQGPVWGYEAAASGRVTPYALHRPERTCLYQLVEQYYPSFTSHLASSGSHLPHYVVQEFEAFCEVRLDLRGPTCAARPARPDLINKVGFKVTQAHTGAVTLIQRFGSALNLNLHFHVLFIDGVYSPKSNGELRCHRRLPAGSGESFPFPPQNVNISTSRI